MLALCLMLSETYYAQSYAGIIGLGLLLTIRLNLEAVLITNHESIVINTVLATFTVTKDSTVASDHLWCVAGHPIHHPGSATKVYA